MQLCSGETVLGSPPCQGTRELPAEQSDARLNAGTGRAALGRKPPSRVPAVVCAVPFTHPTPWKQPGDRQSVLNSSDLEGGLEEGS